MDKHEAYIRPRCRWNEAKTVQTFTGPADMQAGYSTGGEAIREVRNHVNAHHLGVAWELLRLADRVKELDATIARVRALVPHWRGTPDDRGWVAACANDLERELRTPTPEGP